jgi:hypothetical protein
LSGRNWSLLGDNRRNGVGLFKNLILKNYEAKKAEFSMKAFWQNNDKLIKTIGPLGSNGANENDVYYIST